MRLGFFLRLQGQAPENEVEVVSIDCFSATRSFFERLGFERESERFKCLRVVLRANILVFCLTFLFTTDLLFLSVSFTILRILASITRLLSASSFNKSPRVFFCFHSKSLSSCNAVTMASRSLMRWSFSLTCFLSQNMAIWLWSFCEEASVESSAETNIPRRAI